MNISYSKLNSELSSLYRRLYLFMRQEWQCEKVTLLRKMVVQSYIHSSIGVKEDVSALLSTMQTALITVDEIGLRQPTVCAVLLRRAVVTKQYPLKEIADKFGGEVEVILRGLKKISRFRDKRTAVESENYMKLLLSMAEDIRVVFVMIARQLQLMRDAKSFDAASRLDLSVESSYLYAPLSHRLGLYSIKSELEDLSLKYTDRASYDFVAQKLNETKRSRDKYISEFIKPVNDRLSKMGFTFEIKGRTKSISSILNKLRKQKIEFEGIYDLFAIRIILDVPEKQEKAQCWQVYSVITDMYQPNPKRLKDWLSIPKSNGYESLHITVMGPDARWVEVQIRSRRMDEIAERGLAAHWKYKGVKEESELDNWLNTLRESLEDKEANFKQKLADFKLDLYDEEIFVFSPKGDLYKLPKGACVLDFAFAVHSNLGAACMSGKVNGRNVSIKHLLKSGDQVEINTSSHQSPKQDWLTFVVTSKARTKIRQLLKEETGKQVDIAKETLSRRMKNRKLEIDDALLMQLIKKLRYKTVTDFYIDIASEKIEVNWVIDKYLELEQKENEVRDASQSVSADSFTYKPMQYVTGNSDELIIDQDLTGIDYKLAKCCNPIFGDEIFGFVSTQGIKIHRINCPNAQNLFSRFGYRILKARWSGSVGSSKYTIVLRIIGNDQIDIVANLMSIISKEEGVQLRAFSIDSDDGLFQGNITVMLASTSMLDQLIKKISVIKGVKSVSRLN